MESKLIKLEQQHEKVVGMNEEEEDVRGAWADLPIDFLDLIFSHMFEKDCIRFRLTCKSWQSVTIPIRRSVTIPPLMMMQSEWSQQFPWLMTFYERSSLGIFSFLHPISNETYLMEIPELAYSTFRCYKYGWLLMSRGEHSLYFYHLSTRSIINLPDFYSAMEFVSMSFTAPPTSPDCKVFGHEATYQNTVNIYICSRGDDFWDSQRHHTKLPFKTSFCIPVLYKDVFYHLDIKGRLGAFFKLSKVLSNPNPRNVKGRLKYLSNPNPNPNPNPKPGNVKGRPKPINVKRRLKYHSNPRLRVFKDLPNPKPINLGGEKFSNRQKNYIAQCDGEFVTVFVGHIGDPVHVFKLDWSKMEWVAVESLGNKTMFIAESGSLLIPSKSKGIEDRIYFPRFKIQDGGDCYSQKFDLSVEDKGFEVVFYSLKTQRYHAFGSDFSTRNWIGTEGVQICAWTELDVNIQGIENEEELVWFVPLQEDDDQNDDDRDIEDENDDEDADEDEDEDGEE